MRRKSLANWLLLSLLILSVLFCFLPLNFNHETTNTIIVDNTEKDDSMQNNLGVDNARSRKIIVDWGWQVLSLGYTRKSNIADYGDESHNDTVTQYFLSSSGYRLHPDAVFANKHENWVIKTPVWDSIDNQYQRHGHYELKPVRVKFSADQQTGRGHVDIPVSKKKYHFIQVITWLLFAIVVFYTFYILALCWKIIMNISRGRSFLKSNYRRLYIIGLSLCLSPLVSVVIALITKIFINSQLPSEIFYPVFENILAYKGMFAVGLIIIVVGRAFQQGYNIQSEIEQIA